MKALLLIAHGSRRESSNDEIRDLAARVRAASRRFELVRHAFLEMAQPDIGAAAAELTAAGATDIVVLPYFLAAGNHLRVDIPEQLSRLKAQHPAANFTLAPHLGAAPNMPRLIHEHLDDV